MLLLPLLFACSDPPAPAEGPEIPEQPASVEPQAPADAPSDPVEAEQEEEEGTPAPGADDPTAQEGAEAQDPETPPASEDTLAPSAQDAPAEEPAAAEPEAVADADAEPPATEEPAPEPVPSGPFSYTLTPKGSSLYVQVFKDTSTAASGLSHDHVMSASGWTGSATWDPADPSACRLDISVPVEKLVVDAPKMRAAVGYDTELSQSQRGEVKGNMLSKGQLNADKYKTVSFSARSCAVSGDKVNVTGDFTLKGTTKTLTVPMTLDADADGFSATGSFKVKGSDYGLEPYTAMLGALKNQDTVKITVRVVGG